MVERAVEVGLAATPDDEIFNYAQRRGAVVITKDTGFVDATSLPPGHGGVLLLRFPNAVPTEEVNAEVMRFITNEMPLDDMRGRMVVLEPGGRIRIRETSDQ